MVRINLLSEREKKKRRGGGGPSLPGLGRGLAVPLPLIGGLVLLLLVAGGAFVYLEQARQVAAFEERIDVARQDSTRYSRAIAKIQQIESSQAAILTRIEAIQEVDQGRFRWPHVMDEVSRSLPDNTWLTSVTRTDQLDESARIEITGVTYSNLTLTRFMTNLEGSPFLESVGLIGSTRSVVEGEDVTSFALVAAYSQPPSS